MTEAGYARTLQTVLDDTVGKYLHRHTLEAFSYEESLANHHSWGRVQTPHDKGWRLVFDSDGLVPDLVNLHSSLSDWFWVKTCSVYNSGNKILWPLWYAEILGLWDYEEKLETTSWTEDMQRHFFPS